MNGDFFMSHRLECDIVCPVCANVAGWKGYFIFVHESSLSSSAASDRGRLKAIEMN